MRYGGGVLADWVFGVRVSVCVLNVRVCMRGNDAYFDSLDACCV